MLIFLKNANKIIFWLFTLASLICTICAAVIISHFIWWLFSPSKPDLYVDNLSIAKLDNSIKYIDNRSPFGIFAIPKYESSVVIESKAPVIISHIDLSGIQVNGSYISANEKDSFAFLRITDKKDKSGHPGPQSFVAQVGDQLISGVFLKKIQKENIVVSAESAESTIYFSSDDVPVRGINVQEVRSNVLNNRVSYNRPLNIEPGPVIKEPSRYRNEPVTNRHKLINKNYNRIRSNFRQNRIYK